MSESGLAIFFLSVFLGFVACLAHSYFWFKDQGLNPAFTAFESTAMYLFALLIWALAMAIILTVLGF
jgi:hypothetical protein